jgi:carboxymethylenebutenolidase
MIDVPRTPQEAAMLRTWEAHVAAEFVAHDIDATMATMVEEPSVVHVAPLTGAVGGAAVRGFYAAWFLPGHPPDTTTTLIGRTIGASTIVDQYLHRFTHTIPMPWMLPGVAPTGKPVAIPLVAVIEFQGDRIASERIYFDQASVLAQVGLLDPERLPIIGRAAADFFAGEAVALNQLIERGRRSRP